jgi:hypothetical protein
MGAVFAVASATTDLQTTTGEAVAVGMRATFVVAALLILSALAITMGGRFSHAMEEKGFSLHKRKRPRPN